jgi:hypothetical protein
MSGSQHQTVAVARIVAFAKKQIAHRLSEKEASNLMPG